MIIRKFIPDDIPELVRIYQESHYENDYIFDVFNDPHYIDFFSVVDSRDERLITAGGLRLTPEVVLATDKHLPVKVRREALLRVLQAVEYLTKVNNFQGFTASTDDEVWYRQLLKHGFKPSKGKPLYYSVT